MYRKNILLAIFLCFIFLTGCTKYKSFEEEMNNLNKKYTEILTKMSQQKKELDLDKWQKKQTAYDKKFNKISEKWPATEKAEKDKLHLDLLSDVKRINKEIFSASIESLNKKYIAIIFGLIEEENEKTVEIKTLKEIKESYDNEFNAIVSKYKNVPEETSYIDILSFGKYINKEFCNEKIVVPYNSEMQKHKKKILAMISNPTGNYGVYTTRQASILGRELAIEQDNIEHKYKKLTERHNCKDYVGTDLM